MNYICSSSLLRHLRPVILSTQPSRTRVYHYALRPKLLTPDEEVDANEERLFKPVAPAQKSEYNGSNRDPVVTRMIGMMTQRGERETARDVMRLTFREMKLLQLQKYHAAADKSQIELNPIQIVREAVKNCTPVLVLHSVVRGGILYKVPSPPMSDSTATHMAIRFLIDAAKDKPSDQRFYVTLARELIAASQNQGKAYLKKQELHKKCEENRAYANYRTY
ncbi:unnamed protein product [Calicophoron daubneyi]|uniref:Small ribosomal subunit protein uS7 domain-containing protein n=1 Tax=Calicophoron daubneyi TaxID=300641 RepID=A0AAV2T300_CALDB